MSLDIVTSNIYKKRPVAGDDDFWPFQYFEEEDINVEDSNSPDFFTQKALSLAQKTTAREVFGLTLKDIMGMDYGFYLYLEKIIEDAERLRQQQLDKLQNKSESE